MTENHDYETPSQGTLDWHLPLNRNFERIDADSEIRDIEANKDQYLPQNGSKYLATDTGARYIGDGEEWQRAPSQPRPRVVVPSRVNDPENPATGAIWYREDTDEVRANVGETVTLTDQETSNVTPIKEFRFDDPAPEATVGTRYEVNRDERDVSKLEAELADRGWDSYNYHVPNNLFYTDETVEGSHSMEFCFPNDEKMGFDLKTAIDREEAWVQYYLKFQDGFDVTDDDFKDGVDWANGGKFPGFVWRTGSAGCAGGGDWYDGCDGWSARGMFWDPKKAGYSPHNETGKILLSYYVYHQDQNSEYGDSVYWTTNDAGLVKSGVWYEITMHAKMNTPGEADGVLEAWVDRTKAYAGTDWRFRPADRNDVNVGAWWHVAYFGGGWSSPKDQSLYTDELSIYDQKPF